MLIEMGEIPGDSSGYCGGDDGDDNDDGDDDDSNHSDGIVGGVVIVMVHVWTMRSMFGGKNGSHGDGCNNDHVGGGGNYSGWSGNDSSGSITMVGWVVVTMAMVIMVFMVSRAVGGNQVDEVVVAVMVMMAAAVTVVFIGIGYCFLPFLKHDRL